MSDDPYLIMVEQFKKQVEHILKYPKMYGTPHGAEMSLWIALSSFLIATGHENHNCGPGASNIRTSIGEIIRDNYDKIMIIEWGEHNLSPVTSFTNIPKEFRKKGSAENYEESYISLQKLGKKLWDRILYGIPQN